MTCINTTIGKIQSGTPEPFDVVLKTVLFITAHVVVGSAKNEQEPGSSLFLKEPEPHHITMAQGPQQPFPKDLYGYSTSAVLQQRDAIEDFSQRLYQDLTSMGLQESQAREYQLQVQVLLDKGYSVEAAVVAAVRDLERYILKVGRPEADERGSKRRLVDDEAAESLIPPPTVAMDEGLPPPAPRKFQRSPDFTILTSPTATAPDMAALGMVPPPGMAPNVVPGPGGVPVVNPASVPGCILPSGKSLSSWACYVKTFADQIKAAYPALSKEPGGGFVRAAKLFASNPPAGVPPFKFLTDAEREARRKASFAKLKARGKVPKTQAQKDAAKARRHAKLQKARGSCCKSCDKGGSCSKKSGSGDSMAALVEALCKKVGATGKKRSASKKSKPKKTKKAKKGKGKKKCVSHACRSKAAKKGARTKARKAGSIGKKSLIAALKRAMK